MVRDLVAFTVWLTVCGGEVLDAGPHEILRVRTAAGVLVAHRTPKGRQRWPSTLVDLAEEFAEGGFPSLAPIRSRKSKLRERYPILVVRDGAGCFFCGVDVPAPGEACEPGMRPSIEHLVARAHGGPNHIANAYLAHADCNAAAGALSAPEKIRLREAMRAERVAA